MSEVQTKFVCIEQITPMFMYDGESEKLLEAVPPSLF